MRILIQFNHYFIYAKIYIIIYGKFIRLKAQDKPIIVTQEGYNMEYIYITLFIYFCQV